NVTSSDLPGDWKNLRVAEARFLRAYFYSLLWTDHGGVPVITNGLNLRSDGDESFSARNTSQETLEYMTRALDAMTHDLPIDAATGRVTRGAAPTLKGVSDLFNASPLNNPENDLSRWQLAATTLKQVIELGHYILFDDYGTLFFEENNNSKEIIWARQHLG